MAAKSNSLPLADHIPVEETEAVAGDATNTGILGLLRHKQLCGRLIIMSLEWIGGSLYWSE